MTTLRELAEKATPGPWKVEKRDEQRPTGVLHKTTIRSETEMYDKTPYALGRAIVQHESWYVQPRDADAAYIAAASPDVILGLLDRIAELEGNGR